MKVELDKQSLFALASDTRLEILKALQPNRRTVSQLAEVLGIDKAAVHRHLKKLEEGGFVTRAEDHGFVYYALTWKSRDILSPNDKTKIVILISASLICLLAVLVAVYAAATPLQRGGPTEMSSSTNGSDPQYANADNGTAVPAAEGSWSGPLMLAAIFGLIAVALSYSAYLVWRKPRQKGGELTDTPITVETHPMDDD